MLPRRIIWIILFHLINLFKERNSTAQNGEIINLKFYKMRNVNTYGNVSLCYKNSCLNASGRNARLIATGTFVMLLLIGISALTKKN
jgi:hypothetical protein